MSHTLSPLRLSAVVGCLLAGLLGGCNSAPPDTPLKLEDVAENVPIVKPTTTADAPFTRITAGDPSEAKALAGVGATFPQPLYDRWFALYGSHIGVRVNYNRTEEGKPLDDKAKGSLAGIQSISNRAADFGASDAPMTDEQLQAAKGGRILHIPTAFGAIAIAYNVPGLNGRLRFTPTTLAGIFLGNITRWDDARLVRDNPQLAQLNQELITVHRADGSGTTYGLSDYLTSVSSDWHERVGQGTSIPWPVGIGARGNAGVVAELKQNPYSLGYVELGYAIANQLPYGLVQNRAGNFIDPTPDTIAAAAASKNAPGDLRFSVVNASGANAYPICTGTWLLVYQNMSDASKAQALTRLLWWAIHDGQAVNPSLSYAPVPANITARSEEFIRQIRVAGQPAFTEH